MRLALGVEYDGSSYQGWQSQRSGISTVQQQVENALSIVADHPVKVYCAGRTDSGVHAVGQVIHCDTSVQRSEKNWVFGGNANLPDRINLLWAKQVPEHFDARRSAIKRSYRYLILNRRTRSALWHKRAVWVSQHLDHHLMHQAAQALIGTHDFSSYRAQDCQSSTPVRHLYQISVTRQGDILELFVQANAFLYHMIRNIAGVLIAIGKKEEAVSWAEEILHLKNRSLGGVTAPSAGLYLNSVNYPDEFQLPSSDNNCLYFDDRLYEN